MLVALAWHVAHAWNTVSTTAAADGWVITGQDGTAMCTHGGEPAHLGEATFLVARQGDATPPSAGALTVTRIEYLTGDACEPPPSSVHSEPVFAGLFVRGMSESARSVTVAPGNPIRVEVGFPAVDAYYVHCDRFAFRVTFQAGPHTLTAVAETNVTRVEPLLRP